MELVHAGICELGQLYTCYTKLLISRRGLVTAALRWPRPRKTHYDYSETQIGRVVAAVLQYARIY